MTLPEILTILSADAKTIFAICSMALAVSLILYFKNRLVQDFLKFENKLNRWENIIEEKLLRWEVQVSDHISTTTKALSMHSMEITNSTKSINSDMLKIKENIFELKKEMIFKIDALRETVNYLEREFKQISDNMRKQREQFDENFTRFMGLRSEIEANYSRIMRLELEGKDIKALADKHNEWFNSISSTLKSHKEEIDKFK